MKTIISIVLIVAGVGLFFQGLNRRDSFVGQASNVGNQIANSLDGGARQPKHVVYMVVGGILAVAGVGLFTRRKTTV